MIDLHCHLCFACDDGPRDAREAGELAKALVDAGVTLVACTSHVRPDKGWRNTAELQEAHHRALDDALLSSGVDLPRVRGAEHYVDDEVVGPSLKERAVPYGDSRWLLVELPYQGPPPDLLGVLWSIRRQGFRVLLAHLERFAYVVDRPELVERIVQAGHLVQVNLGSLAGGYSRDHKKAAERLVVDGWASVAAGDCHRADDVPRFIEKGRKALAKLVGDAGVRRLTVDNPRAILDDAPPERLWP